MKSTALPRGRFHVHSPVTQILVDNQYTELQTKVNGFLGRKKTPAPQNKGIARDKNDTRNNTLY